MAHQDVKRGTSSSSSASDFSNFPRGAIGRSGLPLGRNTRLLPVQAKKDLTLGGAPKKVFVPNIPVRRERSEKSNDVHEKQKKSIANTRGGRNDIRNSQGRGGYRNRNRPELIQTQGGVFAEGCAEASRKNTAYNCQREKLDSSTKIALSSIKTEDIKENYESQMLDDLMRDDFIEDDDENKNTDLIPVILPLFARSEVCDSRDNAVSSNGEFSGMMHIKSEPTGMMHIKSEPTETIHIKSEPTETIRIKSEPTETSISNLDSEDVKAIMKPVTAYEVFTNNDEGEGKLLLFQFPDAVSLVPPVQETSTSGSGNGKSGQSSNDSCEQDTSSFRTSLDQVEEGHIGKLQIMKSGKVRLVLGDTVLDVEAGAQPGFLQDLMSIEINGNSGDMTLLDHTPLKLTCRPSIGDLLTCCSL